MIVRELLSNLKWRTPVEVCGMLNERFFFCHYKHKEFDNLIEDHGDRTVHYWRVENNFKKPDGHVGKKHPIKIVIEIQNDN